MATALLAPAAIPAPLAWHHADHHGVILARWYSDDGAARTTRLSVEWPEGAMRPDDEFALIVLSGPELDSSLLDELYDDVARDILHDGHPARRQLGDQDARHLTTEALS